MISARYSKYLGEGCALFCPDWYCKVASNIDSAITTLFSISAREALAASYFSCRKSCYSCLLKSWNKSTTRNSNLEIPKFWSQKITRSHNPQTMRSSLDFDLNVEQPEFYRVHEYNGSDCDKLDTRWCILDYKNNPIQLDILRWLGWFRYIITLIVQ